MPPSRTRNSACSGCSIPAMPAVSQFSIAPVKGLALEHPAEIELTEQGVREDRRFFLVDDSGRLIDGLLAGRLVQVAVHIDRDGTSMRMTFPDGRVIEDDVRPTEPVITRMYGRIVLGHLVDGPWAEALLPLTGRRVHLIRTNRPGRDPREAPRDARSPTARSTCSGSTSAAARSTGADSGCSSSSPAAERTRRTPGSVGGSSLARRSCSSASRWRVARSRPRIPDTGARDLDTLRTIISYRGLRDGENVDFGVYGEVERAGHIRLGDEVRILDTAERSA